MRRLAVVVLLLSLLGCGYHFPGTGGALPGDVKNVYLPLFVNRSSEPQLENLLGNELSRVFSRNANIELVEDQQQAEAILEGTISAYGSRALSYDKNDDISEYRATMTLNVKLRQLSDGRLLWQGDVSWADEYQAADDKSVQEDLEREAIEEISLRISEELLSRMLDDF
jgi:outer membrane lipopolysaccharide assembly protein LptE/RlpB